MKGLHRRKTDAQCQQWKNATAHSPTNTHTEQHFHSNIQKVRLKNNNIGLSIWGCTFFDSRNRRFVIFSAFAETHAHTHTHMKEDIVLCTLHSASFETVFLISLSKCTSKAHPSIEMHLIYWMCTKLNCCVNGIDRRDALKEQQDAATCNNKLAIDGIAKAVAASYLLSVCFNPVLNDINYFCQRCQWQYEAHFRMIIWYLYSVWMRTQNPDNLSSFIIKSSTPKQHAQKRVPAI